MRDIQHLVLYRPDYEDLSEYETCQKYLPTYDSRSEIANFMHHEYTRDFTVIGRYSVLPFYRELEKDVKSSLINSYKQHRYVADIFEWYPDLRQYTPRTHNLEQFQLSSREGEWIVKGETNSRKNLWNTHCYAKNREDVLSVYNRLLDDSLIGQQKIAIREFEEFNRLGTSVVGVPIIEEYRLFYIYGKLVSCGYYWENTLDPNVARPVAPDSVYDLGKQIIKIIKDKINFVVLDIAVGSNGPRLIELNDGQMSGLNGYDPRKFYNSLYLATL